MILIMFTLVIEVTPAHEELLLILLLKILSLEVGRGLIPLAELVLKQVGMMVIIVIKFARGLRYLIIGFGPS